MQTDDAARTIASKKRPHESDVLIMGHVNKVRRRPNTRRREWQVWWEGTDETTWVPEERVPAELVREHYQPLLCWSAHQTRKAMVARDDAAHPSHAGLPPAAATPDDHDDETVYTIDRLVCGKRDPHTGGWVWRVRWDEYAAEHDTFEPEEQIPAAAVREFYEDLLRAVG